ncbi:unnamed protein product, partial [Mesorhabditis belari]|uniref:PAP-associated domain-containing protein n=1 Tax=Mesorhabditis belari TaxID=2138241 RepID=A0AAF3ENI4_9BILA
MEATSTKATTGSSIWRPQDWVPPSKSLPSNNSQTKDAKSFRSRTFTNQQWSSQEKATRPAELKYVAPIPSEKKKRNRQKKRKNISPSLESNPILASPKKKEARKTNGNVNEEKSTKYDSPTIGSHKITDEETISQREIIQKVIQVEKSHQPRKENDEFSRKLGVRCDFDLVSAIKGDLDWYINKHAEAFRVFNEALLRFCANNAQSSNFYKQKEELCQKIVEKVVQVFPTQKVSIHPYGSTVIGTGLQKSDLDVCVGIGNCEGEEVEYAPTSSCKSKLGKIAKNLRTLLRHKYLTFAVIGRCKVPIIKIQLVPHLDDLEIDLNVNSFDGVFNSYLIKYYTLVDHRFVQLSLLVKYWAKELGLCDAQGGMLNSHSYQLMALHYLQCGVSPPILPNLQFLQPEIFNDDRDLEEVTLSSTTELPPVEIPAFEQNNASLGELLCGFFYYFSDFPWQTEAISIRNGAVVSRAEITEEKGHSLMYIQEPYQESNAARTMNRPPLFDWLLSSIEAGIRGLNSLHIEVSEVWALRDG